jgi:hypothetical protein
VRRVAQVVGLRLDGVGDHLGVHPTATLGRQLLNMIGIIWYKVLEPCCEVTIGYNPRTTASRTVAEAPGTPSSALMKAPPAPVAWARTLNAIVTPPCTFSMENHR